MTDYTNIAKASTPVSLVGTRTIKGVISASDDETLTAERRNIGIACGQALGTVQIYGSNTPSTSPVLTAGDGAENSINVNDEGGSGSGGGDGAAAQTWTDF